MKRMTAVFLIIGLIVSGASGAADVSYDYVRLGYVDTELDVGPFDVDGDGLQLEGSMTVLEKGFVFGSYSALDMDFDVDASRLELGGGYRHRITPNVDLVGRFGYVRVDLDAGAADFDDDGILLSGGVRSRMTDAIEGRAALNYRSMDEGDSDTEIELGGDYYFTQNMTVGLGLALGDDATTFLLSGRYSFH